MIAKNEFYGAFLIKLGQDPHNPDMPDELNPVKIFNEASRAWDIIEELQGEPKPGKWDKIQSNDGLFIGNPEAVKSYNDNKDDTSFFTDEQKAEIKGLFTCRKRDIVEEYKKDLENN